MRSDEPPKWLPIRYRGFYDIPRIFVVTLPSEVLVFESSFNETLDEYEPEYTVYSVSNEPPASESWEHATQNGVLRGRIPVSSVRFDDTKRKYVETASISSMIE